MIRIGAVDLQRLSSLCSTFLWRANSGSDCPYWTWTWSWLLRGKAVKARRGHFIRSHGHCLARVYVTWYVKSPQFIFIAKLVQLCLETLLWCWQAGCKDLDPAHVYSVWLFCPSACSPDKHLCTFRFLA